LLAAAIWLKKWLRTLTKGQFHKYWLAFPENKQRKVIMIDKVQRSDDREAMNRVRIVDIRWRCSAASKPFLDLLHIFADTFYYSKDEASVATKRSNFNFLKAV